MAVNVLGTWHVLLAAEAAGVTRVIHFSSAPGLRDRRGRAGYLITSRWMTRTRAGRCAPTACPSASLKIYAQVSRPGPGSQVCRCARCGPGTLARVSAS